ncbi:MAG: hypothetical protein E7262_06920 [Lachnospiraceae bacterium]|nr:hypothetical protein [Lachnospiraceae bacterium]
MEYNKDDLAFYQNQVSRKNKLNVILREKKEQRKQIHENIDYLSGVLYKERKDVERMEKLSLASVFFSVIGKKDEKLNKEIQEQIAAELKYNVAKQELASIEEEISLLNGEAYSLRNASKLCKEAYDVKVQYIKDNNLSCASQLVALESKMVYFQSEQIEIKQAIDAGRNVLCIIERLKDVLNEANQWATLDTLGLFDNLSWYEKRENLEAAEDYISDLYKGLRKFKTELKDIHMDYTHIDISNELSGCGDLIFDNLILDMLSSFKINKTRKEIKKVYSQVLEIINGLKTNAKNLADKNEELRCQYEKLVYSA